MVQLSEWLNVENSTPSGKVKQGAHIVFFIISTDTFSSPTISGMAFGNTKRHIDEIDRTSFDAFSKRNFDEIDRSDFDRFFKKRSSEHSSEENYQ